jgi:hydrogenase maturation protease
MKKPPEQRVLILGVGNLLMGDEGIGVHAVRELWKRTLPANVDVVDGGTAGLEVLGLTEGYDRVVIIDAVDAGLEPGTILRFRPEDVTPDDVDLRLSLHQEKILRVLELAEYLGRDLAPIVIYGVQPEAMGWSTELSPAVQARLDSLLDAVEEELSIEEA